MDGGSGLKLYIKRDDLFCIKKPLSNSSNCGGGINDPEKAIEKLNVGK